MTEFNFFSALSKEKSSVRGMSPMGALKVGIGLIALCALVYGAFAFRTLQLTTQMDYLNQLKTDEALVSKYNATLEVSKLVGEAKKEERFVELLTEYVQAADTASRELLDLLGECLGNEVHFEQISVNGEAILLTGTVPDVPRMTELERKLRGSKKFRAVLMDLVEDDTTQEETLKFSCQLTLNGGAIRNEESDG